MSFILKLLYLLVTSFKPSCFSSDTSYFSIRAFRDSCAFSSHRLTNPKGMSVRLVISKSHASEFPSYIFRLSSSSSASSLSEISHSFVKYIKMLLCLAIALVFYFRSSNLSWSQLNLMYLMAPVVSSLSSLMLDISFFSCRGQ